jgi:predicted dehydrogenase
VGVIGLGSMGKRRLRCFQALGLKNLTGIDSRADRRQEAASKYGVATFSSLEEAVAAQNLEALCISVPPDLHRRFLEAAVSLRLPAFVEAGVLADGIPEVVTAALRAGVALVPSNTMVFHGAVRAVKSVLVSGRLGAISNITHHTGNHLPSWHPWEPLAEHYASRREIGGAREMVVFELRWLTHLLGMPQRSAAMRAQTVPFAGADIDDTYCVLLDWHPALGVLVSDVVARPAVRRLAIVAEQGQLVWDWAEGHVRVYEVEKERWEEIPYDVGAAQAGYNANIGERMYVEESAAFLDHIAGRGVFPHNFALDLAVLDVLYRAEAADVWPAGVGA